MTGFALKVKTKNGQKIVNNLSAESTIKDLKVILASLSNIPEEKLHIRTGFPPKPIELNGESKTIGETGIKSGDTLIVDQVTTSVQAVERNPSLESVRSFDDCPGILMKHVVPADNSCLFTSIHYVLNGHVDETGTVAPWMRGLIAETVSKDHYTYSEAILGKTNKDYCKWIKDSKSWGGAIEISILSNYYGIEIAVVDTINAIINRFGEDHDYAHRVFLLFDGIHYDPLFLEPINGGRRQTIFDKEDERILRDATQLAIEAKASRQYTDVNKFKLKCKVCNVYLKGQTQAQKHAKETGHQNFGEF